MKLEEMLSLVKKNSPKKAEISPDDLVSIMRETYTSKEKFASFIDAILDWTEQEGARRETALVQLAMLVTCSDVCESGKNVVEYTFGLLRYRQSRDFHDLLEYAHGPATRAMCEYMGTDREGLAGKVNAYWRDANRKAMN